MLKLKPVLKNKKKSRKKAEASPVKKSHSPLKNKAFGSPAKNMTISGGSPQKLIDDYLKQEGATTDNPQVTLSLLDLSWLFGFKFGYGRKPSNKQNVYASCFSEQVDLVQTVANTPSSSISQPQLSAPMRPQAPNLAGAIEFNDVKALLKEWITTISGKFIVLQ